jgi:hypothetical protein
MSRVLTLWFLTLRRVAGPYTRQPQEESAQTLT